MFLVKEETKRVVLVTIVVGTTVGGGSKWVLLVGKRSKDAVLVLRKVVGRAVVGGGSKWVLLVLLKVVFAVVDGGSKCVVLITVFGRTVVEGRVFKKAAGRTGVETLFSFGRVRYLAVSLGSEKGANNIGEDGVVVGELGGARFLEVCLALKQKAPVALYRFSKHVKT